MPGHRAIGGSYKLCRVAGVPVCVHWSLLVVLPVFFLWPAVEHRSIQVLFYGLTGMAALLLGVVAHELAHALTAVRCGGRVRDVVLWPLGGLTRFDEALPTYRADILVSLSGPAANLALWGLASLALFSEGSWGRAAGWFIEQSVRFNLLLFVVNIIPAPPLDGSHALQAVLEKRLGHARGGLLAARVGIGGGILLVLIGVYRGEIFWMVLGAFSVALAVQQLQNHRYTRYQTPTGAGGDDVRSWRLSEKKLREEIRRKREADAAEQKLRSRVDALLEKISREGYEALTESERSFLMEASRKLRRKASSSPS